MTESQLTSDGSHNKHRGGQAVRTDPAKPEPARLREQPTMSDQDNQDFTTPPRRQTSTVMRSTVTMRKQAKSIARTAGRESGIPLYLRRALELTDLHCMLVVAEEKCITRAAARLYLSQPALSRRIRRLELSVGTSLFLRHSRSVAPTPAGNALAEHAQHVIVAAEVALQSARAAACGRR